MNRIILAIAISLLAVAPAAATCKSEAGQKKLAGAALKSFMTKCEKDAKDTPAKSVEVSNFDGDSDSATADIAFTGKFFDGQTVEVALVKDGNKWKLDEAVGFKEFDRDAFLAVFKKDIASQGGTVEEARTNLKEAVELFFETASPDEISRRYNSEVYITPLEVEVGQAA